MLSIPNCVCSLVELAPDRFAEGHGQFDRGCNHLRYFQISFFFFQNEVAQHVSKQKEAKAAVDIQRIFRGYVCRNSYNKLLWENRKKLEDQQMVLNEREKYALFV